MEVAGVAIREVVAGVGVDAAVVVAKEVVVETVAVGVGVGVDAAAKVCTRACLRNIFYLCACSDSKFYRQL